MSELKDKYERDGALGFLDVQDDIERLLPGPSEKERNDSRLRQLVTGETRPYSHTQKEMDALVKTNLSLPMFIALLKGARLGNSASKGVKAINSVNKYNSPTGLQGKMKPAQNAAKEAVKETGKALKEAKKDVPKNIFSRILYWANGGPSDEIWANRLAKAKAKDIDTAIDVLSKNAPGKTSEVIADAVLKTTRNAGTGTAVGTKAAKALVDNVGKNWGEWDKGIQGIDDRLEMSVPSRVIHFIKSMTGTDELDPSIWPMDTINALIEQTNAETGMWDDEQLKKLGDDEKIRLVRDVMRGRYNDYGDTSDVMLKNYLRLTNNGEE